MKRTVTLIVAAASMAALQARAADTPGSNPGVAAPTAQDRVAKARKAVDAKDWNTAMRELNVAVREARKTPKCTT